MLKLTCVRIFRLLFLAVLGGWKDAVGNFFATANKDPLAAYLQLHSPSRHPTTEDAIPPSPSQ